MAHLAKSRGCGRRPQETRKDTKSGPFEGCRGRKSVERLIGEATVAYREGINGEIHKLLEDWKEEVKQESETNIKMEDWRTLV